MLDLRSRFAASNVFLSIHSRARLAYIRVRMAQRPTRVAPACNTLVTLVST